MRASQHPLRGCLSLLQQKLQLLIVETDEDLDPSILLFQAEAAAEWICNVIDVVWCFIFISCDEEVGGWRLLEVPG